MRLAAVDVGSNTVHALVADVVDGRLADVAHHVEMPELGVAVRKTGEIGAESGQLALQALESVLTRARESGYEHLLAAATAAVREARDGDRFLAAAAQVAGVPVRLLSGEREAELSFLGVAGHHAVRSEWLMVDLGGASTELVGARAREILVARSLPIGSGTLAAKHLSDPPLPGEREALRAEALGLLAAAPDFDPSRIVVTGGTASHLPRLISQKRPPVVISAQALLGVAAQLDAAPAAELAARHALPEARVRALRGGVEVLLLLLDWAGLSQLQISYEGLRHGMILAYLERAEEWWL